MVRPPRRAQELHLELRRADEDLTQRLGRSPTIAELATEVDASEDHVLEALEAGVAHQATSLDSAPGASLDDEGRSLGDRVLGRGERGFEDVDQQQVVAELLDGLPEREREVIRLRFFENLTQPEIAERMGVSQSYLSRIIRRTLVDLRDSTHRGRHPRLTPVAWPGRGPRPLPGAEPPDWGLRWGRSHIVSGIGPEIIIVAVVLLLVFGSKKIPELARVSARREPSSRRARTRVPTRSPTRRSSRRSWARGGGLEPPISGPEPLVLPITPPPKVASPNRGTAL